MRILVTGGDGQLGNSLKKATEKSPNEYIFTDADDLDITNPQAVALGVKCNDFQAIINCAAYTNVDRAEEQEEIAERINATAVGYLAKAAADNNIPLIHISTDYVFGGNLGNTPRTEEEPLNPTGAYGRTKLHGEEEILKSGCRHIIIRTAWLYSEYGKNFVKTMLDLAETRPEINVVADQIGTPTYAGDLASAIHTIIKHEKWIPGIYHFTDEGVASWYDFTKAIFEMAGKEVKVNPIPTSAYPTPAKRPLYSVLSKSKIKNTYGIDIPYWRDSLRKCLINLDNK